MLREFGDKGLKRRVCLREFLFLSLGLCEQNVSVGRGGGVRVAIDHLLVLLRGFRDS